MKLEQQIRDWENINYQLAEAKKLPCDEQIRHSQKEICLMIKDYEERYNTKYDSFEKPK